MKKPLFSIYILIFICLFTMFGDFVYSTDSYFLDKNSILLSPSFLHPFGTDSLGRDMLARTIEGGKNSIIIGVGSSLIASLIGLIAGLTAGYFKGVIDKSFVVIVDLFLTFPTFFLLLAMASYMSASLFVLIFIISITGWMSTARMIRGETFAITNKPFIKILKVAKVNYFKIIFKYLAPIIAPIFFVSFTFGVGGAILAESGLSFLGLGINPPEISWGLLLSSGKDVMDIAWWISFFPGLFIFLVTFCLINISDYLQNLFNQKQKF